MKYDGPIKLYNTLGKQLEDFKPQRAGYVSMYHCGPTVYDRAHIGNLRSYVFADTIKRLFLAAGYSVDQIINITDIGHLQSDGDTGEDKMTKGLKREGLSLTLENMKKLAHTYGQLFIDDLKALNVNLPQRFTWASEHISQQIELIKKLEEKGLIYTTSDGVYFDTQKSGDYGKLAKLTAEETRIENSEKKHPHDFALWKLNEQLGYQSPWGKGFPGWHIECSAMSMTYLGSTIDIHTGGMDHIPVHHNNEIAQSEHATGKQFVRYWLHHEFVQINDAKMAKSEGTGWTLEYLTEQEITPLAYRYHLLTSHYQSQISISIDTLKASKQAYHRLLQNLYAQPVQSIHLDENGAEIIPKTHSPLSPTDLIATVANNLNTAQLIATLHEQTTQTLSLQTIKTAEELLGLPLLSKPFEPEEKKSILNLVHKRIAFKTEKKFKEADEVRDDIVRLFEVDVLDLPGNKSVIRRMIPATV